MKKSFVTFLTFVRAPLALVGAACAIVHAWYEYPRWGWLIAALVLMGLSALTDLFDGLLARRWKVTSTLGALADPLMDKVFYIATLPVAVFLVAAMGDGRHALILLSITVASLLRDQWVSFLRSVGMMYGADVKANWAGKLRTAIAFPIIMLIFAYLGVEMVRDVMPLWMSLALFALEVALLTITLLSAVIYTVGYWGYLKKALK